MGKKDKRRRAARPRGIDPKKLVDMSALIPQHPNAPQAAYTDREGGVCVQVWTHATPGCQGTPWEGTLRVAVKHTSANTPEQAQQRGYAKPIAWDDMQAIKDYFWPGQIAVEVFPPRESIVDVADMRWIWVLPKGASLPFNLEGGSERELSSSIR